MDKNSIGIAQGLIGEMVTDYFHFYCQKCGTKISKIVFYGIDTVGVQLQAKCIPCDFSYVFKLETEPNLGPIQITSEFGKISYKAYDKRKLKKDIKNIIKSMR